MKMLVYASSEREARLVGQALELGSPDDDVRTSYGQNPRSYWVLLEDNQPRDNQTYKVLESGTIVFCDTGVEI